MRFSAVTLASSDVGATASYFGRFGYESIGAGPDAAHRVLGQPFAAVTADVEIVHTDDPLRVRRGWECGPVALDIYCRDLDVACGDLAETAQISPVATLRTPTMTMRQAMATFDDSLPVVMVEATSRRSSVLDDREDLLYSEPHSVVWAVHDHLREVEFWAQMGFAIGPSLTFENDSVGAVLGLQEPATPLTMTMVSDEAVSPIRLEVLTFDAYCTGPHASVQDPTSRSIAGLRCEVDDGEAAEELWVRLGGSSAREVGGSGCMVSPGGVVVTLAEPATSP